MTRPLSSVITLSARRVEEATPDIAGRAFSREQPDLLGREDVAARCEAARRPGGADAGRGQGDARQQIERLPDEAVLQRNIARAA